MPSPCASCSFLGTFVNDSFLLCVHICLGEPLVLLKVEVCIETDFDIFLHNVPLDRVVVSHIFAIASKELCAVRCRWPLGLLALELDDHLFASQEDKLVVIYMGSAFLCLVHCSGNARKIVDSWVRSPEDVSDSVVEAGVRIHLHTAARVLAVERHQADC